VKERVAAVHFTPAFGEVEANRAALVSLAREAAEATSVVVLPELATTGFCLSRGQAEAWAEPADGPTVTALASVAKASGAVIVVGLALRDADALHNAQVVIDADGSLAGTYSKHHLFGDDHAWATAGVEPGAVVSTSRGDLGLLVCHDIVHVETVLAVTLRRPRMLAFSTAWIGDGETLPSSWTLASRLLDPAPLVVANRGGVEGNTRFTDPSAILSHSAGGTIGPRGVDSQILTAPLP